MQRGAAVRPKPEENTEPFASVECGMQPPIIIRRTPESVRSVCAYCGSRYLGEVWSLVPEHLQYNFLIVKD